MDSIQGSRFIIDTDKGRVNGNFINVNGPSTRYLTEDVVINVRDCYFNALVTAEANQSFVTPLVNMVPCYIHSSASYFKLHNNSSLQLSDGPHARSYPLTVSTVGQSIGLFILIFSDNVWVPYFYWNSSNNFIPATSNAFGGFTLVDATITIRSISSSELSEYSALGESLKSAVFGIDPYDGLPSSRIGGGDGTYDFSTSTAISFPTLPTLSAVSTGFVSLWSPTVEQMLDLSSFMWNADVFTTDFWKKLIANPMDLIYGLSIVPLNLQSLGYIDGTGTVVVGLINTGIEMDHLSSQWVEFDCGSINVDETWGAYLDYDPYTKLEIYLPFCGVHPLKVDDFMPGVISLKYYIDLLSGTCIAVVKSTKGNLHDDTLDSVVYQFMGNCAAQIPVTAQQFADAVRSAISIAASIGSMVATGVGGAAALSAAKNTGVAVSTTARIASQELSTGASAVENVMNLKPAIERSGAIGSSGALLGVRTPYLILTRPRMARPDKQSVYTGYPSFITETLGDLTGWTIVQAIHLDGIPCTSEELNEIDALLKGGVIF